MILLIALMTYSASKPYTNPLLSRLLRYGLLSFNEVILPVHLLSQDCASSGLCGKVDGGSGKIGGEQLKRSFSRWGWG